MKEATEYSPYTRKKNLSIDTVPDEGQASFKSRQT